MSQDVKLKTVKVSKDLKFHEKSLKVEDSLSVASELTEVGEYLKVVELYEFLDENIVESDEINGFDIENPGDSIVSDGGERFTIKTQSVNTQKSDIPASFYKNEVLLLKSKNKSDPEFRLKYWTGNFFYKIFIGEMDENSEIKNVKPIKNGEENSSEGAAFYSEKTGYLYFTQFNYDQNLNEAPVQNRLKILRAKFDGKKISDIRELSINNPDYTTAHPYVTPDGKRMYFSSDRPGGYGGMDIYYVNLSSEGLTQGSAINLGEKINSAKNEIYPTYNKDQNLLFFSSDGHEGYGGLDVYVARLKNDGTVAKIENLNYPINSRYDDFSFINDQAQTRGYFSSNRAGGKGDDDIYGFIQHKPYLKIKYVTGYAKNILTGIGIENAKISLLNGRGDVVDSTLSDKSGFYEIGLDNIREEFQLKVQKGNFVSVSKLLKLNDNMAEYAEDFKLPPDSLSINAGNNNLSVKNTTSENGASVSGTNGTSVNGNKGTQPSSNNTNVASENGASASGTNGTSVNGNKGTQPPSNNTNVASGNGASTSGTNGTSVNGNKGTQPPSNNTNIVNVNNDIASEKLKSFIENRKIELVKFDNTLFNNNSSYLTVEAANQLNEIANYLLQNPQSCILIEANADSKDTEKYNMWLSKRRGNRVADYLTSKGVSTDRISVKSLGETNLKFSDSEIQTSNNPGSLMHQNRRVEYYLFECK
jgi:outer membrane protein OmpA-like peptidoglycan-associated protein